MSTTYFQVIQKKCICRYIIYICEINIYTYMCMCIKEGDKVNVAKCLKWVNLIGGAHYIVTFLFEIFQSKKLKV